MSEDKININDDDNDNKENIEENNSKNNKKEKEEKEIKKKSIFEKMTDNKRKKTGSRCTGLRKLEDELNNTCERLKTTEEKLEVIKNSYQILAADFDNFRKRSRQEKLDLFDNAIREIVFRFLPVIDNFERAIENIDNKGIELLYKQIANVLDELGVELIKVNSGDDFDSKYHESIAHVEDDLHGENKIVDILQKGYLYKNKVIRYAKVRVAN
ncbi:MAG: nucleotide exchange factor GrpE [Clostridiales bacterium]|nr:nucleotide exchange factor GrpE [Clostridiales bacterium]